jgi:alpha-glucosidase (family GH31 glycosyl hydrolase)
LHFSLLLRILQASSVALPVMRPLWVHYPSDAATFAMEDQHLLGRDLLVKPVTQKDQSMTSVYLPGSEVCDEWFHVFKTDQIHKPLNKIFQTCLLDFNVNFH